MTEPCFSIKTLEKEDRSGFLCGKDALDRYFQRQISQDIRRHITTAFIAIEDKTDRIAGFYTLSASEVPFTDIKEDWRKKLPRYPTLPAVRVGRLAIDTQFQGLGLGSALLADAAARAIQSDIGAHFLVVDALDQDARAFYLHLGFQAIPDMKDRLFIPLSILRRLLAELADVD